MITYGIRARLAWYWRRLRRKPAVAEVERDGAVFFAIIDQQPYWRKPHEPDWTGWQETGYTTDEPPPGLRRS